MAKKWNLQDIVPPERARKAVSARAATPRQLPPQEMRVRAPETQVRAQDIRRPGSDQGTAEVLHAQPSSTERAPEPFEDTQGYYAAPIDDRADTTVSRLEISDGRLSRMRTFLFSAVAIAILCFVGFGATALLSGAEVTIRPKIFDTTIQASFQAKLQPEINELGYELLTLEEEGERQVAATGQEEVSKKAEGEIIVYNGYGSTPQKLVKNTRFEAPGGLIYRIQDAITIPGYKKDQNGNLVPGSVRAKVVADGTGENYNIANVRLSIPGLKGTDQFTAMYAEVDKLGISGGFEGTMFIIDEVELATTKQKLHTELRDKLLSRIGQERPNGFILFDPAITFIFDSLPSNSTDGKTAVIKERARLQVPLFNEVAFAAFLAQSAVPSYNKESVRIDNPQTLTFAYEQNALDDLSTLDTIFFTLKGSTRIVWRFDEVALRDDFVGAKEDDLADILKQYPSIEKARSVVRPMWKSRFPSNPEEIKIIEDLNLE